MWGIAVLCGNLKLETSSGMHVATGWCDTAGRWDCDALPEFGRKPVLSAPPCRMLDMHANMCYFCEQAIGNFRKQR